MHFEMTKKVRVDIYEKLITSAFFEKPFVDALVCAVDIPYTIPIRVLLWLITKDQDDVIDIMNSLEDLARDVALRRYGLTGEVFNFLYFLGKQEPLGFPFYRFRGFCSSIEFRGASKVLDQLSLLVRMYTPEEALSKKVHNGTIYHLHKHWYKKRLRCLARRFHQRLTKVQFVELMLRKNQRRNEDLVRGKRVSVKYGEQIEPDEEDDIRDSYLLGTTRAYKTSTRLPRICDFCGAVDESNRKHLRCAKCRTASYCSRACQTLNWYTHREICIPLPYISKREFYRSATKDEYITNEIESICDLFN
jgi:hypothetical protein